MGRVALYWYNGRSFGHTARAAALSTAIARACPDAALSAVTGARRGLELLPDELDVVKLPAIRADTSPQGVLVRRGLGRHDLNDVRALRGALLRTFFEHYRPQLTIVDHVPHGGGDELAGIALTDPDGHAVLGLRSVIDEPSYTNQRYFSPAAAEAIAQTYTELWVYGDPAVLTLEELYDVPPELAEKIRYTGYVLRPGPATRAAARAQVGYERDEPLIVVNFGGGWETGALWNGVLQALKRAELGRALLVTGGYTDEQTLAAVARAVAADPRLQTVPFTPALPAWIRASDLYIGSGGSNSLGEMVAFSTRAVAVPRDIGSPEQLLHAERLRKHSALHTIPPEALAELDIATLLREPPRLAAGGVRVGVDGVDVDGVGVDGVGVDGVGVDGVGVDGAHEEGVHVDSVRVDGATVAAGHARRLLEGEATVPAGATGPLGQR